MRPARFVKESTVYGRRTFAVMEADNVAASFALVARCDTIAAALRVRDALDALDDKRESDARVAEWRERITKTAATS